VVVLELLPAAVEEVVSPGAVDEVLLSPGPSVDDVVESPGAVWPPSAAPSSARFADVGGFGISALRGAKTRAIAPPSVSSVTSLRSPVMR
jgi:hypothetical protein